MLDVFITLLKPCRAPKLNCFPSTIYAQTCITKTTFNPNHTRNDQLRHLTDHGCSPTFASLSPDKIKLIRFVKFASRRAIDSSCLSFSFRWFDALSPFLSLAFRRSLLFRGPRDAFGETAPAVGQTDPRWIFRLVCPASLPPSSCSSSFPNAQTQTLDQDAIAFSSFRTRSSPTYSTGPPPISEKRLPGCFFGLLTTFYPCGFPQPLDYPVPLVFSAFEWSTKSAVPCARFFFIAILFLI